MVEREVYQCSRCASLSDDSIPDSRDAEISTLRQRAERAEAETDQFQQRHVELRQELQAAQSTIAGLRQRHEAFVRAVQDAAVDINGWNYNGQLRKLLALCIAELGKEVK